MGYGMGITAEHSDTNRVRRMTEEKLPVPKYYSPKEVAAMLRVSLGVVYELFDSGTIEGVRVNSLRRYREDSLLAYMNKKGNENDNASND